MKALRASAKRCSESMEDSRKLLSELMSNASALSDALQQHGTRPRQSSSQNDRPKFSNVDEECSSLFRGKPSGGTAGNSTVQQNRPSLGPEKSQAAQPYYQPTNNNGEPSGVFENASTPQFTVRKNFGKKRKMFSTSSKGSKVPKGQPKGPFRKDLILLCGPNDDLVPRQGHKLYLAENQHIIREVLFMKQWSATDVMEKIKEILRGRLKGCEEIELLESVHRKVVPPTIQPGDALDGERISKIFKEKPIYVRPQKQILKCFVQQDTTKKKGFKFSVTDCDDDCYYTSDEADQILEKPAFNIVHAAIPDEGTQEKNSINPLQHQPISIPALNDASKSTSTPIINITEEYDALFKNNAWELDEEEFIDEIVPGKKGVDTNTEEACASTSLSIYEILENLAAKIDTESIAKFNISRNHLWESAKRGFNRKSFCPEKRISAKFTDDIGVAEGAVDSGGPKREFLTLLLQHLQGSALFQGEDDAKLLTCTTGNLMENDYFIAGQIISMSLVHGGPAPKFLSQILFDAIHRDMRKVKVSSDDVPDVTTKQMLKDLESSKDVNAANEIIAEHETLFQLAGTPCFVANENGIRKIVEDVAHWYVLERCCAAINQFKEGLKILGVLEKIKAFPEQFKPLFCFGSIVITAEAINKLFQIEYSEKGSNRHASEENTLSFWFDFLQDVEEGESDVIMPELLFFFSGCKSIPPLGFQPTPQIQFLHWPEENGKLSSLPKGNTCANVLHLPVVHKQYAAFKESLEFGFRNAKGFGYA